MQAVNNFFKTLVELIGPGAVSVIPRENDGYEGTEYKAWRLVFRPALYKYEIYPIAFILMYLIWWRVGRAANRAKAKGWLDSALPILEKNFTLLAPNPKEEKFPLIADGSDAFLSYASGRRGTLGMHTTISLIARHDPLTLIYNHLISPLIDLTSSTPSDTLTIAVSLRPESNPSASTKAWGVSLVGDPAGDTGAGLRTGTWGVLRKEGLNERRRGRWDLSFPQIQPDSTLPAIADTFAVLSESFDITTALLAPSTAGGSGLKEILEDAESSSVLRSLVISDLPAYKPYSPLPHPSPLTITVVLALPPSTPAGVALTTAYLQVLFNLTDLLTPSTGVFPLTNIKPDTVRKMRKVRIESWKEIKEAYSKEHVPVAGTAAAKEGETKDAATTTAPATREYVEWKDDDEKKPKKKPNAAERKAVEEMERRKKERKEKMKGSK
ncbi:hypothetical protein BDY24DRAFT_390264 [Mrakia frigida]|uniref:CCDC47 family protein n=1 Tax=Mrakia frigida TaxID=29902 RepID=UPI003FCC13B2